ncbi:MAG: gliding motility-associated C-terminal domain-containing protein, partial [Pedobacter sp.]
IKEVDGPAIDDSAVQISDATCLAPIGSIKNLKVTGAGKLFYVWRNANREIVSEDLDADNLPEGSYILQVFDESSCGVLESKAFVIKTLDKLELNDQNAVSSPTSCNSATGSIKGITHKGATIFKWLDQDNAVVGNAMELTGVAAGTYRLIISNDLNCTQESRAFTINVAATVYPVYDITLKPSTCNRLDGTININFGTGTPPTEIRVVDQNEVTIGNTSALKNLKPGKYKIYFKNVGECETFYKEVEIEEIPALLLNVGGMSVKNDDCGQGEGYIKGINISGGMAPYTYRWVETISGIGLSTLDLSNLHAGNYRLTVSDASSCIVATDAITILDEGTYVEAPFVDPISACPGTSIKVKARHQQSGSGTYSLYEGATIQPVSTNITGEFKIVADPARSYSLSYKLGLCESVRVPLKLDLSGVVLRIPNTFSPNGDGINDVWSIPDVDKYSNLTISVFNRNGQKVYTGNGTDKPFDGSLNGSILSAGTYFYIIDMKGACGNLTGSVTILK